MTVCPKVDLDGVHGGRRRRKPQWRCPRSVRPCALKWILTVCMGGAEGGSPSGGAHDQSDRVP
eukprot:1183336-Prorocentrum_minimum.AAC.3